MCGREADGGRAADPDALMPKAQLCPDRDSLGFRMEFRSGTVIGTVPIEALYIRNGGLTDLQIASVTTAGDSAFKYTASWDETPGDTTIFPTPYSLKGNKSVFIQVEFAPTQAKLYSGTITVTSNAENTPNKVFTVAGCGIPADGGTSPCYRDGG